MTGVLSTHNARPDHRLIADLVEPGSRLLDVGCGDGTLLELLAREKNVDGRGIEISQEGVNASVRRGLSVIQGDADTDLADYPDAAFDYVVLSQTLPAIRDPKGVLLELLRIGQSAIVSIPNFGYWRNRLHLLLRGRMPAPRGAAEPWHETPQIRPCTIKDFVMLCRGLEISIDRRMQVDSRGKASGFRGTGRFANLVGEQAVFLLSGPTPSLPARPPASAPAMA